METNRPSKLGLFRCGLAALSTCTVLTLASGCNGSSSVGVEPGIGDDPADITALTILGVVTDAPIASADVTATVDGQSFTTMAGTDGTYELEVRFETEAVSPEALVQVTGVGVGPQAGVALVSQVGSIAALVSAAGDDGRLDREEQPRLVVSHLSTARYLLATDINGGTPPASEAELAASENAISPDRLLTTAGLIKLIVDEGLIAIPEDSTLLDILTSDEEGVTSSDVLGGLLVDNGLADENGELLPEVMARLDAAIESTLADDALRVPLTVETLVGQTVWTEPTARNRLPGGGSVYELLEDGTGAVYALDYAAGREQLQSSRKALTWSIDDNGRVEIVFDDWILSVFTIVDADYLASLGFGDEVVEFVRQAEEEGRLQQSQVQLVYNYDRARVRALSATPATMLVQGEFDLSYSIDALLKELGWVGEPPRARFVEEIEQIILRVDAYERLAPVTAGEAWAVPVLSTPLRDVVGVPQEVFSHELFTLDEDGMSGTGLLGGDVYAWSVDEEGDLVLSSGPDAYSYEYRRILGGNGFDYTLVTVTDAEGIVSRRADWVARVSEGGEELAGDLVRALPSYWQAGTSLYFADAYLDDGRLDPQSVFGYTFSEDGTSSRIFGGRYPACLAGEDACFTLDPGWQWMADGTRISRVQTVSTFRERLWEVLSYDAETGAVVLEWGVIDFGDGLEWFVFPRLNPLEPADLDAVPEAYQDALEAGLEM
jgi:hypothetical protein